MCRKYLPGHTRVPGVAKQYITRYVIKPPVLSSARGVAGFKEKSPITIFFLSVYVNEKHIQPP